MKINYGDDIEGFEDGVVVRGKKTGDGPLGVCLDGTRRIKYENILKVNGKVYTDHQPEEPKLNTTQLDALKVAEDCQKYIDRLYPHEDT